MSEAGTSLPLWTQVPVRGRLRDQGLYGNWVLWGNSTHHARTCGPQSSRALRVTVEVAEGQYLEPVGHLLSLVFVYL